MLCAIHLEWNTKDKEKTHKSPHFIKLQRSTFVSLFLFIFFKFLLIKLSYN